MEPAADFGHELKGDLRSTPFAHLLLELMAEERFGTLLIHDESGTIDARIRFEAGLPTGAHSGAAEQSVAHMLIPLCARTHGGFAFLDGKSELGYGDGVVIGRADPLAVIAAAMRGPTREDAIDDVLSGLGDRALELDPGVSLARFPPSAPEHRVLETLQEQALSMAELRERLALPAHVLRRAVYLLAISRSIHPSPETRRSTMLQSPKLPPPPPVPRLSSDPPLIRPKHAASTLLEHRVSGVMVRVDPSGAPEVPPTLAPPPPPPSAPAYNGRYSMHEPSHAELEVPAADQESLPPSQLPPALALWRKEILERLAKVEQQQTYFELLGLPTTASDAEIDRAFNALYDHLQPDLLPDALASLRDAAETVLQQLIEAHDTLRDPRRRLEYRRRLQNGERANSAKLHAASAESHREQAEALLKRKDYAGALQAAERAFRLDHSAAHEAFYGWLLYLRHSASGRVHPAARKHLQTAVLRDPRCEQAQFYAGCLLKQFGRSEQAYLHFKRAAKLNPKNTEAVREVRLYETRANKREPGVIERLLQRDRAGKRDTR